MTNTWPGWENAGLIGEGSFGKVYRIRREEFGRTYEAALKVITIPVSQADMRTAFEEGMDEESVTNYFRSFVEDIVAEFALMSELKGNSNIVSYEDHMVVEHKDGIGWDILIRMELLTALPDYAAKHPLKEADVIRLGIDMAQALTLCRMRGIVHRDIKPENIFVSKDGDFKLGDFGVARVAEKTVSAMSRKGTYNYMAPEVYKGEEYGYAADLYSLGLVLYRFLNNNRTPFLPPYPQPIQYSDKEKALNRRMDGEALPPPTHGSRKLQEIILKACAFRPEERYGSAQEFNDELRMLLPKRHTADAPKETGQDVWKKEESQEKTEDALERTISVFSDSKPEKQTVPAKKGFGSRYWIPVLAGLALAAGIFIGVNGFGSKDNSSQGIRESGQTETMAGETETGQTETEQQAQAVGQAISGQLDSDADEPESAGYKNSYLEGDVIRIGIITETKGEQLPFQYLVQEYPTVEIAGRTCEVELILTEPTEGEEWEEQGVQQAQLCIDKGCQIVCAGRSALARSGAGLLEEKKIPILTYGSVVGRNGTYTILSNMNNNNPDPVLHYMACFAENVLGANQMLVAGEGAVDPMEDVSLICQEIKWDDMDPSDDFHNRNQYTEGLSQVVDLSQVDAVYMGLGIMNSQHLLFSMQELGCREMEIPVLTYSPFRDKEYAEEYGYVYQAVCDDFWEDLGERDTFGPGFREWLDEDWNRAVVYGVEGFVGSDAYYSHDLYMTALQALAMGGNVTQALDTGTFTGITGTYRFETDDSSLLYGDEKRTRYISIPIYSYETDSFVEFTLP